jgi:two-component system, OmpR family, alkaline phosphatase synthesis response regulator PhoP
VSYRLFLVEDEPRLIRAISDLLVGQGYVQDITSIREFAAQVGLDDRAVRIEAFLRRTKPRSIVKTTSSYQFGPVKVNFRKSEVSLNGSTLPLSERESRLLLYLIENRGRIVSRDTLLEQVWGYSKAPFTRTVDVTILRLRQKVEADPRNPQFITTVHGLGYRFDG